MSNNIPEEVSQIVPIDHARDRVFDVAAAAASAIPGPTWLTGPIANVLSGMSTGRKFERIQGILEGLAYDLQGLKVDVAGQQYVKTEDFEDLLEKTLKQAAEERSEEKRRIYKDFLVGAITSPGQPYDDQIVVLRLLETLQPDHIRVLKAMIEPATPSNIMMGSPRGTLEARLRENPIPNLQDLVNETNSLRLTNATSLNTMMTGNGASNLEHFVTPLGRRLLQYILAA